MESWEKDLNVRRACIQRQMDGQHAAAFVLAHSTSEIRKIKQWRSVKEQNAKNRRCVHVRARLSRTTSPALTMPCNWGENKDRNYMFIFDNNFNLLCSPSENETPTKRRWESALLRLKVELDLFNRNTELREELDDELNVKSLEMCVALTVNQLLSGERYTAFHQLMLVYCLPCCFFDVKSSSLHYSANF